MEAANVQHLADQGQLSHSNLADGMPEGWHTLGENVAYASTLEGALKALENSPPHRANMLNPAFDRVAIGVTERNGSNTALHAPAAATDVHPVDRRVSP